MASFFQPPLSGDPTREDCSNRTHWVVYCNNLLPDDERLVSSAQWFTFILAVVGIGVPTILALGAKSLQTFRAWRKRRKSPNHSRTLERAKTLLPSPCLDLSTVESFCVYGKDGPMPNLGKTSAGYDLLIVAQPFLAAAAALTIEDTDQGSFSETSSTIAGVPPPTPVLGLVDGQDLGILNATEYALPVVVDYLFNLYSDNAVAGLVIDCGLLGDNGAALIPEILVRLCELQVPVILKSHHDSKILKTVNLKFLAGIIIENACILEDGTRRDYFRSVALRDVTAKCAEQRVERPTFFVGFLDRWNTRPSAAVVRRSQKLAAHFAAVFEHRPATNPGTAPEIMPQSLSAFEYLRRSETADLQSSWMQRKRITHVGNGRRDSIDKVASLPFGELQTIIPNIDELLMPLPLPDDLQALRMERPIKVSPPDYLPDAPIRDDFWERTSQDEKISQYGCIPLLSEPTPAQHEAILDTQIHLRNLKMLHRFSDAEINKLVEGLRKCPENSKYKRLIDGLANGLKRQHVFVYKGLGSGFTLPDNTAEFWGVSAVHKVSQDQSHRDSTLRGEVDMFISRRCPSDLATVLHTWLAHHNVPRIERYEEELRIERIMNPSEEDVVLPLSIRHEIENATPAETLSLLEQIKVSSMTHHFKFGIEEQCRLVLIDQASLGSWNQAASHGFLSGSASMEALLRRRLQEFIRLGANRLPSVANLLSLYRYVDEIVTDSLFAGDREKLNTMTDSLLRAYDPWNSWTDCDYVDVNADLFALIFFSALRTGAFEDVYIETTDRCPFFLSQPDQAAVFSELWALGSSCEVYFGMLPRDLGEIVYNRYRVFLEDHPPPHDFRDKKIMTAFAKPDTTSPVSDEMEPDGPSRKGLNVADTVIRVRQKFAEFGALSIFCLPAIIDIMLLTFVGRGLFMTAWLGDGYLNAACYALLMSLLISAGVTGWVGSIGNYYICNYAYDNMIYFHVQRLSGGFVLTVLVGIVGFIIFAAKANVPTGVVFFLYLVVISMYLNVLGVMATMHQNGSPLTSGRTVLWRTIPIFFLSPLISTFSSGHDLQIYLPVSYGFLFVILFQYRNLCHEWSTWMTKIPRVTEKDILSWYNAKMDAKAALTSSESDPDPGKDGACATKVEEEISPEAKRKLALLVFCKKVEAYHDGVFGFGRTKHADPLVARVAKGMPYLNWLLKKDDPARPRADTLSPGWFGQVSQALKTQESMLQGLKEHNIFILFRYARFDIGSSVGLFLVALMDRWVSIVMSARYEPIVIFVDSTARYGICFAIFYFCASVMTLDMTLQNYWSLNYTLSDEKLSDFDHAKDVEKRWESRRRRMYLSALLELSQRLLFWLGLSAIFVWSFVKNVQVVMLFYFYVVAYTSVMIFQFNRCFTTDVKYHVGSILSGGAVGFIVGCTIHGIYGKHQPFFTDVIALNTAAIMAAALTTFFVWKDPHIKKPSKTSLANSAAANCWTQPRLSNPSMAVSETSEITMWKAIPGTKVTCDSSAAICERIPELLRLSISQPNLHAQNAAWSEDVLKVALEMWKAGRIELNSSTRTAFIDTGFGSSMSISRYDGNMLEISTGYLLEDEIDVPTWQPLLAYFATEAILFHTARAIFHMDRQRAIQAEHFLHETEQLSRRIDFELSTSDLPTLMEIQGKTNIKVMKHLCLGIHVDSKWRDLPPYVRDVIFCRILGDPVPVSHDLHEWMADQSIDLQTSDFHLETALVIFQKTLEREHLNAEYSLETGTAPIAKAELHCSPVHIGAWKYTFFWGLVAFVSSTPTSFTKWVGILTGAGSDVERELWYKFRYSYARAPILWVILTFWRLCWFLKNLWTYVFLIYHRKNLVRISRMAKNGASRTLVKDRVIIEQPRRIITGFATRNGQHSITLEIFDKALSARPTNTEPMSTAMYDDHFRLASRQDKSASKEKKAHPWVYSTYFYPENSHTRWPSYKEVIHGDNFKRCYYDKYGRVTHGIMAFGSKEYEFKYSYKTSPRNSQEVLRAEFKLTRFDSTDSLAVYWGVPLRADVGKTLDWVPSDRVCRVVRKIGTRIYTTTSNYAHRRDPTMMTVLEDGDTRCLVNQTTPVFPEENFMQTRPTDVSFDNDDPLIRHRRQDVRRVWKWIGSKRSFKSLSSLSTILNPGAYGYFREKKIYSRVPTWWLRTELWNNWLKSNSLDGITACWMDELILREEPTLQKYWSYRSSGRLTSAKKELDENIEQIVAATEIEKDVSEVCMLPIKAADLYAMGLGKDANQMTTRPEDCFKDTQERISVIFNDVGCWPESPGGVSNCRRDLVNGHSTIRNHVLAESANEYGIPRFQIEKNVQSLKTLPLWGLDGKTPNHGVIDNLLQSEVDRKIGNTEIKRDVVGTFVPLLKQFVKGARSRQLSRPDLLHFSNVMLTMFKYFEHKDYNETWNSKEVAAAWAEGWLEGYEDPTIMDPSTAFELSQPTMTDFRDALAIYKSYFFIFSVQTPENCPQVFQSTHHGISSLFGMLLKYKRGTTFGIWDHAILWRECCLNISPAQCELSIPVQTMLLGGIGLATRLAYFHADVILPCTSFFNPVWEADLGTDRGQVAHRNQFRRKIDPIVNGVGNMDAFEPVDHVRTEIPTVIMLSNVQFIKDVRTAILAADVIINKFGFKDYRLVVYGAQDREPQYTIDMTKLIQQCKMSDKVILGGFGRPQEVLKDAWLFMNSSLSEGLPLAIAEAALAGVPIVATAVGATALVLTDPDDTDQKYGEVVPPNDPVALARAQISMLSMVGPWAKFTGEVGEKEAVPASLSLPDNITAKDVEHLTRRMYEKVEFRRELGMLSRGVVLKGFHGKRYLREHEQMYWIQWHLARMRADEALMAPANRSFRFGAPVPLRYSDVSEEEMWAETEEWGVLDVSERPGRSRSMEEGRSSGSYYGGSLNSGAQPLVNRKRSIRWQEFPPSHSRRGSFLTVGSYEGKKLSKQPRRPWVESRSTSYISSREE